jgi:predicted DNA-binding transcriptional regulator YafY
VRAGRLITLLRALQTRGRMTAGELATALEVSERTIYRDIEALSGAGVPVYAVRGSRGGFELLSTPGSRQGSREPDATGWPAGLTAGRAARARIRLSPQGRRLAAVLGRPNRLRLRGDPAEEGWVEASLRIESLDSALPDLLALGAEVEVLAPPTLRRLVAETAQQVASLHAGAAPH